MKVLKKNNKANFDFSLLKKYEAGIVLRGFQVKLIKKGKVGINDARVFISNGELFITNMHFYDLPKDIESGHNLIKLLLSKSEIHKIQMLMRNKKINGFILNVKLNEKQKIKFDIGFGESIKKYQKKNMAKSRSSKKREVEKELY